MQVKSGCPSRQWRAKPSRHGAETSRSTCSRVLWGMPHPKSWRRVLKWLSLVCLPSHEKAVSAPATCTSYMFGCASVREMRVLAKFTLEAFLSSAGCDPPPCPWPPPAQATKEDSRKDANIVYSFVPTTIDKSSGAILNVHDMNAQALVHTNRSTGTQRKHAACPRQDVARVLSS